MKIIEEPPSYGVFLLTCDNRSKLLPTILSRVVTIPVATPTPEECLAVLPGLRPDHTEEEYQFAATLSEGSIGRALAALEASGTAAKTALVNCGTGYVPHGAVPILKKSLGLDGAGLFRRAMEVLGREE